MENAESPSAVDSDREVARQHNQALFDAIVKAIEDADKHAHNSKSRGKVKARRLQNIELAHMKRAVAKEDAVAAAVAGFWAGVAAQELQLDFIKDATRSDRQKGQKKSAEIVRERNKKANEALRPYLEQRLAYYLARQVPNTFTRDRAYKAILFDLHALGHEDWTLNRVKTVLQRPQRPNARKQA